MSKGLIAKTSVSVSVPIPRVWDALTNPEVIKRYMFGTNVVSDWEVGSRIVWKGEWQGKEFEDKGTILKLNPRKVIQYSHFSPLSGLPDTPENYHIVTIKLSAKGMNTLVSLSQDNNSSEQEREHSEKNWGMMLAGLKRIVEN